MWRRRLKEEAAAAAAAAAAKVREKEPSLPTPPSPPSWSARIRRRGRGAVLSPNDANSEDELQLPSSSSPRWYPGTQFEASVNARLGQY